MTCDICRKVVAPRPGRGRPPKRHVECRKIAKAIRQQRDRYAATPTDALRKRLKMLARLTRSAERALELALVSEDR